MTLQSGRSRGSPGQRHDRDAATGCVKGKSRSGAGWSWLVAATLLLSSCGLQFGQGLQEPEVCSRKRLDAAIISYEDAKDQFEKHFATRTDTALIYAYHGSKDAVRLARSIRDCFDFEEIFKEEATELIKSNRMLQRLIVINLRDSDPQVAISLFSGQYRDIIKNDIN